MFCQITLTNILSSTKMSSNIIILLISKQNRKTKILATEETKNSIGKQNKKHEKFSWQSSMKRYSMKYRLDNQVLRVSLNLKDQGFLKE